jgi:hypothetical protein
LKKILLVIITAFLVVVAIVIIIRNRDEYRIKKKLKSLAALVTKSKGTNEVGVAFLSRVAALQKLFSKDCSVSLGETIPQMRGMEEFVPKMLGIEEVIAVYTQAMRSVSDITVTFHDISLNIEDNRKTAETLMTAKVKCSECYEGEEGIDAREFEMGWEKVDGKWKIQSVNEVKTLY